MLRTICLEIRDSGTFIPAMATHIDPDLGDNYLIRRAGYTDEYVTIILTNLVTGEGHNDVYDWNPNTRTMRLAHKYIQKHFHDLNDGDVIDIEYINGWSTKKKESERHTCPL